MQIDCYQAVCKACPGKGHFRFVLRTAAIIFAVFLFGCTSAPTKKFCFKNICVSAQIADSDIKRQQGLMFRKYIGERQGMLFVFDREDRYGFWMKNMQFPLDIVWISENKRVVYMKTDAKPCVSNQICESLIPAEKAKYVLEVNAGFVSKYKIKSGDEVKFSLTK